MFWDGERVNTIFFLLFYTHDKYISVKIVRQDSFPTINHPSTSMSSWISEVKPNESPQRTVCLTDPSFSIIKNGNNCETLISVMTVNYIGYEWPGAAAQGHSFWLLGGWGGGGGLIICKPINNLSAAVQTCCTGFLSYHPPLFLHTCIHTHTHTHTHTLATELTGHRHMMHAGQTQQGTGPFQAWKIPTSPKVPDPASRETFSKK